MVEVLTGLYSEVDELLVVDDGSTDRTRALVQAWLPGHDNARLIWFDQNRGLSAAYLAAFTELRRRLAEGELDGRDIVFTVDADGQHDLAALEGMRKVMVADDLDAVIARRDLKQYPAIKRLGNAVMSWWATLWARHPLHDVESGYRLFRLEALSHSLDYYKGYRYSEAVEVAIVLCRLGYAVNNDVSVPVPVMRSRTRLRDAVIDLAAIPLAWWRVRKDVGTARRSSAGAHDGCAVA